MKPNPAASFRLRFRHIATLVIFFTIFLGVLVPLARKLGATSLLNPTLLLLLAAPWLLAVVVLVVERKSPVKFWLAPFLLSLVAPILALSQNWALMANWLHMQTIPNLLGTLVLNILLIGTFTLFAAEMCPRRCPQCKRLSMIPLRNLWGPGMRTPNTRWCASCGAKYWRTCDGEWREERRRTWLDNVKECRKADAKQTPENVPAFNPESRNVAPMISAVHLRVLAAQAEGSSAAETGVKSDS